MGIVKRWWDIFGLTVAGTGGGVVLSLLLTPVSSWLVGLPRVSFWLGVCGAAALAAVLFLKSAWRGWRACLGLRHFWRYPPPWLASLLAAAAVLQVWLWQGCPVRQVAQCSVDEALSWAIRGLLVAGVLGLGAEVVGWFVAWRKRTAWEKEQAEGSPSAKPELDLSSYDKIVDWLKTDDAIDDPKDDMLDHKKIARRIVRRLASNENGDRPPTIAVIGPLGSGKTTIAKLVERRAKKVPGLEVVRLSLWPYAAPEAAVRGVLKELLKKLGEHVSTLSLRGVPQEYVGLIEKMAGRWGVLAPCLRGLEQPEELIEKFDEIAGAVGIRVVMWIEDMERFASREGDAPSDPAHVTARLNPIRSLLHLLDESEHISVIVADCSLDSRFDLEKIVRYVERIPPLDAEWVRDMFRLFRDGSLKLADDLIDPADPKERQKFLEPPGDGGFVRAAYRSEPDRMYVETAITVLLSTPRLIKSSLRCVWEIWDILPGEIDLDIVLVASVIREERPKMFAFFAKHISLLSRGIRAMPASHDKDPGSHPAYVEYRELLGKEGDAYAKAAVDRLSRFVFGTLPTEKGQAADAVDLRQWHPQGFVGSNHTDYWQRYLAVTPIPEEESDQAALKAIRLWKEGKSDALVQRIRNRKSSVQIEHFAGQFGPEELIRLLLDVARAEVDTSARFWGLFQREPPVLVVWRMMLDRRPDEKAVAESLCLLIREIGHRHLPLMWVLKHYFASPSTGESTVIYNSELEAKVAECVRKALVRWAAEDSPESLLKAFQDGDFGTLGSLIYEITKGKEAQSSDCLFEGWHEIAAALLKAAEYNPEKTIPHILPLVADIPRFRTKEEAEGLADTPARFMEEDARRLFDFPRLRRILAESEIPDLEGQAEQCPEAYRESQMRDAVSLKQLWTAAQIVCRRRQDEG